jgi:hypothetical protein
LYGTTENGSPNGDGTLFAIALVSSSAPQPALINISLRGCDVMVMATNGRAGKTYYLLVSTNVAEPRYQWSAVATNILSTNGNVVFIVTNALNSPVSSRFYILQSP